MKTINALTCILLLALGVSCSSKQKKNNNELDQEEVFNDLAEEELDKIDDSDLSLEGSEVIEGSDGLSMAAPESGTDNLGADNIAGDQTNFASVSGGMGQVELSGGESIQFYTVSKNETLMMIAFKLYGEYTMWRKLVEWNRDKISGADYGISVGMSLKYIPPVNQFSWNPSGSPYLIKNGDTLGTISSDVYGERRHWKYIWDNNRPLIRDPNLIFAGFTLYYLELSRG